MRTTCHIFLFPIARRKGPPVRLRRKCARCYKAPKCDLTSTQNTSILSSVFTRIAPTLHRWLDLDSFRRVCLLLHITCYRMLIAVFTPSCAFLISLRLNRSPLRPRFSHLHLSLIDRPGLSRESPTPTFFASGHQCRLAPAIVCDGISIVARGPGSFLLPLRKSRRSLKSRMRKVYLGDSYFIKLA